MKPVIAGSVIKVCVFICGWVFTVLPAGADEGLWQESGIGVCTAFGGDPTMISDGGGGAIIAWNDERNGNPDIYMQRINNAGETQWAVNGIGVCTAGSVQTLPRLVSDGYGGAIAVWNDERNCNFDLYAQRINHEGLPQWTADGIGVCTAANQQYAASLAPDGGGGAIVVWVDYRSGNGGIYLQRVSGDGIPLWAVDGVEVNAEGDNPQLSDDGVGGAIVVWHDDRNGYGTIYAQRVNNAGVMQWGAGGLAVCAGDDQQTGPQVVSDDNGGAICAWLDYRNGKADVYAQRFDPLGTLRWGETGIGVCTAEHANCGNIHLVPDGHGGAIIAWTDDRNGNCVVRVQRLNNAGGMQWTGDGVAVEEGCTYQDGPKVISDGNGGAIVVWNEGCIGGRYDIYAQHLNYCGVTQWGRNGLPVCTIGEDQWRPWIISDVDGGAILAWDDQRNGANGVYAQRLFKKARPHFQSINSPAVQGTRFHAVINGSGFLEDQGKITDIRLTRADYADITAENISAQSYDSLSCEFDLISAAAGEWQVRLYDNYAQYSPEEGSLTLVQPTPTMTPTATPTPETIIIDHYRCVIDPQRGIMIYDSSDSTRLLAVLPLCYISWHIYIHENYVYLVDGHGTLEVKEISDPFAPRDIGRLNTGGDALGVSGFQNWVLVADGTRGVAIYDVSMPNDIRLARRVATAAGAQDVDVNESARQAKVLLSDQTYVTLNLSDYGTAPLFPEGGYATPNPFLPLRGQKAFFNFRFDELPAAFTIRIYNLRGQLQRTLTGTREWDGRSDAGHLCEGGVYVYQIEAEGKRVSGKVVMIK